MISEVGLPCEEYIDYRKKDLKMAARKDRMTGLKGMNKITG